MGNNYGTVDNCTASGSITTNPGPDEIDSHCGGIAGYNYGTVTRSRFDGDILASVSGGIVGRNSGTVTDCHKPAGSLSGGGYKFSIGGVIGLVYSANGINFDGVTITGNTFSKTATGQEYGIGEDHRESPPRPSNNGAEPIN